MIVLPDEFVTERVRASGAAGRAWLDSLPALVDRWATKWNVEVEGGEPRYGANALVVLGRHADEPVALKLCWPGHPVEREANALRAWRGHGVPRLLADSTEANALLLEGLDASRSLESVDITTAAEVVGGLIRQLAIPAPRGFVEDASAADAARSLPTRQAALHGPLPTDWVSLAATLTEDLERSSARTLIHTDLHSGNVLAGSRQPWLAIDPRPAVGDPELGLADLLLWRLPLDATSREVTDLLDTMVAAGDLDATKARAWTLVRAVSHWLWCLEEDSGLPPDAPRCAVCDPRCRRILEALT